MVRPQTDWVVRKRDGRVTSFDLSRIGSAMENAFRAEMNLNEQQPLDAESRERIKAILGEVSQQIAPSASSKDGVDVEEIQDAVELTLMKHQLYRIARRYIVYRTEHAKLRALRGEQGFADEGTERVQTHVTLEDGVRVPFDPDRIVKRLQVACSGLEEICSVDALNEEVLKSIYDGITTREIYRAMILAARTKIEKDPAYDTVAARLMLNVIYHDALGSAPSAKKLPEIYRNQFEHYVIDGITAERLTPALRDFNLTEIAAALVPERDEYFQYLGLQTIYDRYLIHVDGRRIEAPQFFWMRVAMGLALKEGDQKEQRAIEFYNLLSTMRFTSATPTLFNSATLHPQLSSCYLSTVSDDLEHIFKSISDNAKLSKWAGGLGNDWTNIRATNAHIHGTNGQSQGVIPFLKVVNDTAVAVNQGGKRKGAVCAYLETWHLDIEEFLDLRKNTGDDRRRTHDMHTANWIPDLFMKRVEANADWTLFSPDQVSDLHDLTGQEFEQRYCEYERMAEEGDLELHRKVSAVELWRKMLTRLFETGHPWITWKDPSNIRSPQDHCGVVHSSNLCTEILLNTSEDETAVCNLGSINLKRHIRNGQLDLELLQETVRTAMRMLDNVIDINYYPTDEAKNANQRHRPVGLGLMGFQDALLAMGLSYSSQEAVEFADRSMEAISYYAILASSELAKERGRYSSYEGSKWDRGLLPIDTLALLEKERGQAIDVDRSCALDWTYVRESVNQHGMRNSNCMAIAPTATISTIIGVSQSIEPSYKHLYVKSNLSGEFTQVNSVLVTELKERNLWDEDMLDALKYFDGCLAEIDRVPADIKERYKTAFELEPFWLLECAARRQKWIDMGQSLNLYMQAPSGKKLDSMYLDAWKKGLKTTYYLRSLAATQIEKSTIDINKFGIQPRWMKNKSASGEIRVDRAHAENGVPLDGEALNGSNGHNGNGHSHHGNGHTLTEIPATMVGQVCDPNNPDCEACQ